MTGTGAAELAVWRDRPERMVRELFGAEPEPWQDDALVAFPHSRRIAIQGCAGAGKTAVAAWLAWNFLLTRADAVVVAVSSSGAVLRENLWSDMGKWHARSTLLKTHFAMENCRIYAMGRRAQ